MPPDPQATAIANIGSAFAGAMPTGLTPAQQIAWKGVQSAFAPNASIVPTPSPSPIDGATTSYQVTNDQAQTNATTAAAGALTSPQGGSTGLTSLDRLAGLLGSSTAGSRSEITAGYNETRQMIESGYSSALASVNDDYRVMFDKLSQSHVNEVQAGQALAARLNPYSGADTTAQGFTQALNARYQSQYAELTSKMHSAQNALNANKMDAYVKLKGEADARMNALDKENRGYIMEFFSEEQTQKRADQAQANADRTFGFNVEQLKSSEQRASVDDFRIGLSTLNYTPEYVDEMVKSGAIFKDPTYLSGVAAYGQDSSESIISSMKQGSLAAERIKMQQDAAIRASEKSTNAQLRMASMQNVQSVSSQLIQSGKEIGSLEYATRVAQASASNPYILPTATFDTYKSNFGLLSQLESLKPGIDAVNKNSTFGNIIFSRLPKDVNSLSNTDRTVLNSELKALSGQIGKGIFGESGNLSNTDIQRVLDRLPTSGSTVEVRNALYTGLVSMLSSKVSDNLPIDAIYYNVAGLVPYVQKAQSVADGILSSYSGSGNSGKTSTGMGWTIVK